ncbi:MAG: insulinase family protein [Flavobacteriales bacterium]|nr:MAG: insulinase family protein [Flavobacteriales bacterium]CAI8360136.1 MAG: putative zinc protease [Flavobacteriales bacterium]|tara:strand:+ start:3070 stop:4377 length:1308 start_codon:yes stop_codon:yes gene_type:complete
MKKILATAFLALTFYASNAQEINFVEYDLENGLHVILHQDNSAPVVSTSVMYLVGSKEEDKGKTGFAHFFEHVLFTGSKNIKEGEWDKIVNANGGFYNANTGHDRTYYFNNFPSNKLELTLWIESERMLHPIITEKAIKTQQEVVKEEKRLRENQPYGDLFNVVSENLFKVHPYNNFIIGSMDDLSSASVDYYLEFNKKFHVPNNAALVVAGDIDIEKTRDLIKKYFSDIPRGVDIPREYPMEEEITSAIKVESFDKNIQIPAYLLGYRTPGHNEREAYVMEMISIYLSSGQSSKLYKKIVDEKKLALQISSQNLSLEDYGVYFIFSLPMGDTNMETIMSEIDSEIELMQTNLISDKDFQKLQNIIENRFVSSNSTVAGIGNSLAHNYFFHDSTNHINTELDIYKSISKEEIRMVAKKLLGKNQRLELKYLPENE